MNVLDLTTLTPLKTYLEIQTNKSLTSWKRLSIRGLYVADVAVNSAQNILYASKVTDLNTMIGTPISFSTMPVILSKNTNNGTPYCRNNEPGNKRYLQLSLLLISLLIHLPVADVDVLERLRLLTGYYRPTYASGHVLTAGNVLLSVR